MAVPDRADQALEAEVISFVSTGSKEADFQSLCTGVVLHATEACYVSFDGEPATAGSFLLLADTMMEIEPAKFTRVNALAVSTGGNLHILAKR